MSIKVKKTAKSLKSKLGTVADGVKSKPFTASGVKEGKLEKKRLKVCDGVMA